MNGGSVFRRGRQVGPCRALHHRHRLCEWIFSRGSSEHHHHAAFGALDSALKAALHVSNAVLSRSLPECWKIAVLCRTGVGSSGLCGCCADDLGGHEQPQRPCAGIVVVLMAIALLQRAGRSVKIEARAQDGTADPRSEAAEQHVWPSAVRSLHRQRSSVASEYPYTSMHMKIHFSGDHGPSF